MTRRKQLPEHVITFTEDFIMKNIVKYFKLLKFGLQTRTMAILAAVFGALGIVYELIDFNSDGLIPFSGLYLGLAGMYIYQVVITSGVSSLVQVSPLKKKLLCAAPVIFTGITTTLTFTIFVILRLTIGVDRFVKNNPGSDTTICYVNIIASAALLAFLFLYFSFSYRYYIVSTVIMAIILFPCLIIFVRSDFYITASIMSSVSNLISVFGKAGAVILSYLILWAGCLICYLCNLALYRKPLSSIAYRSALRQASAK